MTGNAEQRFLPILIGLVVRDLKHKAEQAAVSKVETTLAIVVDEAVRFAFGPLVAGVLPLGRVAAWGGRMTYEASKEWLKRRNEAVGTVYNVRTTNSGILIAENLKPATLQNIPLPLPQYAEYPLTKLITPNSSSFQRIGASSVFRELWNLNQNTRCLRCGQAISKWRTLELGHTLECPQNYFRQTWSQSKPAPASIPRASYRAQGLGMGNCVICGQLLVYRDGVEYGHAATCFLNRFSLISTPPPKSPPAEPVVNLNVKGSFENIWVDYNVSQDSGKGMRIHTTFTVDGLKGSRCRAVVYFYFQSGDPLKDFNGLFKSANGNVAVGFDFTPNYDSTIFEDSKLFIPYEELHLTNGKHELQFRIRLYVYETKRIITTSRYYKFIMT